MVLKHPLDSLVLVKDSYTVFVLLLEGNKLRTEARFYRMNIFLLMEPVFLSYSKTNEKLGCSCQVLNA